LAEGESRKRDNLKGLIRTLCDLSHTHVNVPAGYDVLRGQTFHFYGLTRAYIQELCLILELCPLFEQKNNLFYSDLFKTPPKLWIVRLRQCRMWRESGYDPNLAKKFKISKSSPVIQEVVESGFQPFNPFSHQEIEDRTFQHGSEAFQEIDKDSQQGETQSAKPSIIEASSTRRPQLGKGGYEIPFVHDTSNPNNELLSSETLGSMNVFCLKGPYSAHDVYHHKMSLIPDLVVNKTFALLALVIGKSKENPIKAKTVLRPKIVDSDFSRQMEALFKTLNSVSCFLNFSSLSIMHENDAIVKCPQNDPFTLKWNENICYIRAKRIVLLQSLTSRPN